MVNEKITSLFQDTSGKPPPTIEDIIHHGTLLQRMNKIELTPEECHDLGSILSRCKRISSISLRIFSVSAEMLTAIFQSDEGSYDFPLEKLNLAANRFGTRGLAAVAPFLKSCGSLDRLDLADCRIDDHGAEIVGEVLDTISVKLLNLVCNQFGGVGLARILSSANSKDLKSLSLSGQSLGRDGFEEFGHFLTRDGIGLERIKIPESLDIEWFEILLSSLRSNTTTKELIFFGNFLIEGDYERQELIYDRFAKATINLLCDASSFENFCQSNHTVSKLTLRDSVDVAIPLIAECALMVNSYDTMSINAKLRWKLRSIFFWENFELHPFLAMRSVWMPHVLELVSRSRERIAADCWKVCNGDLTRGSKETLTGSIDIVETEGNLNGMYKFIRCWNFPDLCSFYSNI